MKLPHRFPKALFVGDRVKSLLNLARGRSVLHLGCADPENIWQGEVLKNSHLQFLMMSVAKEVYGIDIDEKALSFLATKYGVQNLFVANVQDLRNAPIEKTFDIILAAELIEHLSNPGLFLDGVKRFMHNQSILAITTPNAFALKTWIWHFLGRESAHKEHTFMFYPSGLIRLLYQHDFVLSKLYTSTYDFYHRRSGTIRNYIANKLFVPYFIFRPHHADCLIALAHYNERKQGGSI